MEEQATLKTSAGLTDADNSNATVQVSNATIDAGDSDISIGKSATLVLCNGAIISAANINMAAGATLMTTALTSNVIQSPAIAAMSLSDAESASSAVFNTPAAGTVDGNLTFEAGSTLVADGAHFNMSENSILTFKAISGGEKINLVLTLGAEYGEDGQVLLFSDADVAKFILDGEEVSGTYTFNANDFFTGAWINNNTKLCYSDKTGLVYVQNVNSVAIPEPTTATLSLLALAALAARRRRTQEK